MKALNLFWLVLPLLLGIPLSGSAAGSPQLNAQLTVVQVRRDGNLETTQPAAAAKPGDVLEYAVRYQNRGDGPAEALIPTLPIPSGTQYEPTDRTPKPSQASLDGVSYGAIPLRRRTRVADGTFREVDVPVQEYRALRWNVGRLDAASEVTVRARVRITSPAVVDATATTAPGSH